MQFLSDSLLATVLVGAIVLMLAALSIRQQEESGGISSRRAIAGQTASLEMHVASDFQNVMAVQAATDSTVTFTVVTDPSTMATAAVTYDRSRRVVDGDTLFDVERRQGANSTVVGPGLSDWTVVLRDSTGSPTPLATEARQMTVRFVATPAFPSSRDTLDVVWERSFSPSLLRAPQF